MLNQSHFYTAGSPRSGKQHNSRMPKIGGLVSIILGATDRSPCSFIDETHGAVIGAIYS